jgi:hypothetical protein
MQSGWCWYRRDRFVVVVVGLMPVSIATMYAAIIIVTYRHIHVDARQIVPVGIVGVSVRHDRVVAVIRYLIEGSQHPD